MVPGQSVEFSSESGLKAECSLIDTEMHCLGSQLLSNRAKAVPRRGRLASEEPEESSSYGLCTYTLHIPTLGTVKEGISEEPDLRGNPGLHRAKQENKYSRLSSVCLLFPTVKATEQTPP